MTTIHEIEMQRRAFEAWQYTQNNRDRLNFHHASNEWGGIEYDDISIDYAWQGWLAAKQHTTPQSAWISVADRLPENSWQEVNVLLKTGEVRIALFEQWIPTGETKSVHYWNIYHIDGHEYRCIGFDDDVTHWQPLPQPPKAE